jgi:hypothetical protein
MEVHCDFRQVPKPGSNSDQCEDAFDFSSRTSTAAVCDGAGTAFESRRWARLLTKRFAMDPPREWTRGTLMDWTALVADDWTQSIPWANLNLFEEGKARSGSAATLLGLQFQAASERASTGAWRCLAVGDSCLFQVRGDQLVRTLPLGHSADFTVHPPLLSTDKQINAASLDKLVTGEGNWQKGDRFFLLTDAIAQWFLSQYEARQAPWDLLASSPERDFATFVQDAQTQGQMRKDDVTVLMIGVGVPVGTPRTPVPIRVGSGLVRADGAIPLDVGVLVPAGLDGSRRPQNAAPPGPSERPQPNAPRPARPKPTRPEDRRPWTGPGRRTRSSPRRRMGWIMAGCVALGAAIGLVAGLLIGGSPAPKAPPVQPSVPPVQPAASSFAEALTSYDGGTGATYQAYEAALQRDVVGGNAVLVSGLVGLAQPPGHSVMRRADVESVAVIRSGRSRAKLYVVVQQQLTTPHTYTTPHTCRTAKGARYSCPQSHIEEKPTQRRLLLDLTMARQGQKWLVSDGHISLISAVGGAPSPASAPNGGTS